MPRHWSRSRSRIIEERGLETGGMSQGQILVPELVDVHPIAASLWSVIAALPTLLYRYAHLFLSQKRFARKSLPILVGVIKRFYKL